MWHLILACALSFCSSDPLDKLERKIDSYTFWEQSYDAPIGTNREPELSRLARLVQSALGVQVQMTGAPPGIAGISSREHRVIALDGTLSPNAKLQVLAHEAAHILQPPDVDTAEAEVFADAVSYMLTGDDVAIFSRYLAGNKSGLHVIKTYRKEIDWAVKVLRGR